MRIYNASIEQIDLALWKTNRKYKGNIIYKNFETRPEYMAVTLKTKDADGPGAKLGQISRKSGKPRKTTNACYHVHGDFLSFLLHLEPRCYVYARDRKIHNKTDEKGNVTEYNVNGWIDEKNFTGDRYDSECCDCDLKEFDHG